MLQLPPLQLLRLLPVLRHVPSCWRHRHRAPLETRIVNLGATNIVEVFVVVLVDVLAPSSSRE